MKTYAEFLTEAAKLPSEAELTKVFFHLDPKDRGDFLKWKAKAIEMYNIDNSSFTMSQENNFNKAFFKISKKLASGKQVLPKSALATPERAPVKISKNMFDTKKYVNALNKALDALDDAKKAARDLQDVYTDFDRKTKGSISNSERNSVSVYSDSLDVLGDAYTEIKNRINTASKLKAAAEAIITKLGK
ncbi:hypothetical protein Shfl2p135 [Shigella phage Shfl2]|uniref:Uncharacterized protein n=1 Tax=Shigella phage Shfl2 TaxID=1002725 RepID=F2VXF4_9CAUD|nr:hypothetical protein Shfl2p135 [Shigella phage Shfl2]AEA73092.1 hypothetical protein Shfl2p135 [Shigella phage Shfl2]